MELSLDQPITLLAGDNGSGKSTVIEALAEAIGFAVEGGSSSGPASGRPYRGRCEMVR